MNDRSVQPSSEHGMREHSDPVDPGDLVDPVDPGDPVDPVDPGDLVDPVDPGDPGNPRKPAKGVNWLAHYVYGTIATLVAIAGLTFDTNPGALTTASVVIVGALAIWMAHTLSVLVSKRSHNHLELSAADVMAELRDSWAIVTASLPATAVFILAGMHVWSMHTAFVLADMVGVLALAIVGIGTAGGSERPLSRRIAYVVAIVLVGVAIVLLEASVHLL